MIARNSAKPTEQTIAADYGVDLPCRIRARFSNNSGWGDTLLHSLVNLELNSSGLGLASLLVSLSKLSELTPSWLMSRTLD